MPSGVRQPRDVAGVNRRQHAVAIAYVGRGLKTGEIDEPFNAFEHGTRILRAHLKMCPYADGSEAQEMRELDGDGPCREHAVVEGARLVVDDVEVAQRVVDEVEPHVRADV